LLAWVESQDVPAPDSTIPCAKDIAAGTPVRTISCIAICLYFFI